MGERTVERSGWSALDALGENGTGGMARVNMEWLESIKRVGRSRRKDRIGLTEGSGMEGAGEGIGWRWVKGYDGMDETIRRGG